MAQLKFYSVLFLFVLFTGTKVFSQTQEELEIKAYDALNAGDFAGAYQQFDFLSTKYPKKEDYKIKLGICCLKYPEKKERAIEIFQQLKNSKTIDADFYLGKAYHVNYKFTEAKATLNAFLQEVSKKPSKEEKEMKEEASLILSNCDNGLKLIQDKVIAYIQNIGAPVNTDEDEYVPSIPTDESVMIFTYKGKKSVGGKLNTELQPDPVNGEYLEDVYITHRNNDSTWSKPEPIKSVNTKGNDASISISPDGRLLFTFFSSNKSEGDIYVSTLNGTEFGKPSPLNSNINTQNYWEGSCSISADGRYLYFASERPGGLGGRDIWVSEKVEGDWGPAKNLGPNINTPLDDDAPFIHPDGITLFFSSKGHQSIGGYDIMFSVKKDNDWITPKSMGLPLNTTEDDRYYVINSRGDKGYFSSNRSGSGGFGGQDIYMVTPGILGEKPVIALLKGVVYGDDKPVEARIEVLKIAQKENIGPFLSNNKTGSYLMALSPGFIYRLAVKAEGFESVEEDLDIANLNKYMETIKDFYLYSPNYTQKQATVAVTDPEKNSVNTNTTSVSTNTASVAKNENKSNKGNNKEKSDSKGNKNNEVANGTITTDSKLTPCNNNVILPDFATLKGKSLNDLSVYNQLLTIAGNYCSEKLIFKVQIGAYRKPENFKYANLKKFGKAEVVNYPDGITRFTQMQFTLLNEAEAQRQKAIASGQADAWIVAFVDGKRYTLEELIMLDFLGKAVN